MDWREVWIFGNGPSAGAFDDSRAPVRSRLVINSGMFRRKASAFFSVDSLWVAAHRREIEMFAGERHVAIPTDTFPGCAGIPGVTYWQRDHGEGLCGRVRTLSVSTNSGYGALALAHRKGARTIHLVGYDMDPADNPQYAIWAGAFDAAAEQLLDAGVRVLNHNRRSHVAAFERVD